NQIVLNQTQGYLSCIYEPTGREYINILYRLEVTMGTLIGYDLFYFKQTKEINYGYFPTIDWDRCLFTNYYYSFNLSSYYNPAQPVLSVPFHVSNQEFFFNLCGTKNAQCDDDFACFNGYHFKSRDAKMSIDDEGPKLLITYSNSFYPTNVQVEVKFNTKNDIYINNNNNRIIVQSPNIDVIKSIHFQVATNRQFRAPAGLFKLEYLNDHLQSSPLPAIQIQISDNNGTYIRDCPVVKVNSGQGYITCQDNPLGTEIFSSSPNYYINLTIDTQAKGYYSIGSAGYSYVPSSDTEYIPMIESDFDKCIFRHYNYTFDLSQGVYDPSNPITTVETKSFVLCGNTIAYCGYQFCPINYAVKERKAYLIQNEGRYKLLIEFVSYFSYFVELDNLDSNNFDYYPRVYMYLPKMVLKQNHLINVIRPPAPRIQSTITIKGDFIKDLPIDTPTPIVTIYSTQQRDCSQVIIDRDQEFITCQDIPIGDELFDTKYRVELNIGDIRGFNYITYSEPKEISRTPFINVDFDKCVFEHYNYTVNFTDDQISHTSFSFGYHEVFANNGRIIYLNICGSKYECDKYTWGAPACVRIYRETYRFSPRTPYLMIDEEGPKLLMVFSSVYDNPYNILDYSVIVHFGKNQTFSVNPTLGYIYSPKLKLMKNLLFSLKNDEIFRFSSDVTIIGDFIKQIPIDNTIPIDISIQGDGVDGNYFTHSCQDNTMVIDRIQGTINCQIIPSGYEVVGRDYRVQVTMGESSGFNEIKYIEPIGYSIQEIYFKFEDKYLASNDLNIHLEPQKGESYSFTHTTLGTLYFTLAGFPRECAGSRACSRDHNYDLIKTVLIKDEQGTKIQYQYDSFNVELSYGTTFKQFTNGLDVFIQAPFMTLQKNLEFSITPTQVPLMESAITLTGDFIKSLSIDGANPSLNIVDNQPPFRTQPCTNIFINRNAATITCVQALFFITLSQNLELTVNNNFGLAPITYRPLQVDFEDQAMIKSDYGRCIFTHKAYTIDLSDLVKDPIFNVGQTFLAICGGPVQNCTSEYWSDPANCGCDLSDSKRSMFNRRVATLKKDEEGIKLVIRYQTPQNDVVFLEIGIGTEKRVYSFQNYFYVFRTPQMKIKNHYLLTLQTPSLPRYAVSTLRLSSDYIKSLPANNLQTVSVKIYNSLDTTDYRECPQPIIDQSQGFISCQCTPTGKEGAWTNYIVMASIDNVDFYSSASLFFYAPQEISRQPMIESNFERCIFKSKNYIFDLTQLYNPNDPPYIFDNYRFTLCGHVTDQCGGDIACNWIRNNRREAFVLVDQQAVKLLMVYTSVNDKFSVEVFPGAVKLYRNGRLIIQSPLVLVRNIISFTTDYSISRASQSTMTINGDFVKGLTSDTPIKIFVRTFDDKYYSDCTQTLINSNQGVVTCQINPTGNELLDLPYQLIVDVNNTDSGSSYFYFHPKSCPSSCGKGTCDTLKGVCLCEQGYTSYDCSLKLSLKPLSNPSITQSPIDQLNTGYQSPTSSDLVFTIDLNSLAISNSFGYILNSTPIRSNSNVQSVYGTNSATFSSQSFKYDLVFSPSIAPNGTSNSVLVCDNRVNIPLYNQAAAITSISMYSTSPSDNVEAIYEISNNKMNSMSASININKDSIIINDSTTDSYLLFSVSPLFKLNNKVSPYIARARILTTEDVLQLQGYKSTSIYVSILVPSTKEKDVIELITTINSFTGDITVSASSVLSTPLFTIIISIYSLLLFFV
ncbi:hypothetical protein CYY_008748, partial [Polysphondylium violaceum]